MKYCNTVQLHILRSNIIFSFMKGKYDDDDDIMIIQGVFFFFGFSQGAVNQLF